MCSLNCVEREDIRLEWISDWLIKMRCVPSSLLVSGYDNILFVCSEPEIRLYQLVWSLEQDIMSGEVE